MAQRATDRERNFGTWLIDRCAMADQAPAIVEATTVISHGSLARQCQNASRAFSEWGCQAGDRAIIALSGSAQSLVACLGAMHAGIVPVLVEAASFAEDWGWYLQDATPRLCVTDESVTAVLADPARRVGCRIVDGGSVESMTGTTVTSDRRRTAGVDPDGPALVLYTSGSLGIRKGVVHSHTAAIAACESVAIQGFRFSRTDRVLSTPRLSFAFGFGFGACLPLSAGASTIFGVNARDLDVLAMALSTLRPTVLCAVPSLLASLWRANERWLSLDLSSLDYIVSAGEPLPAWLFEGFRDRYGVEVLDGLGSTELLTHVISNRRGEACANTCGVAMPGVRLRLMDEQAREVPCGSVGRLEVSTASAFLDYLNRPGAASAVRCDGWVATGDMMYQREDGRYVYCGRSADTIKVNGMWVMPSEVADHLRTCPAVSAAFVTTCDNGAAERKVVAYVAPRNGAQIDEASLTAYCGALPLHMIPAAFVLMSELPLSANGKVDRRALPAPRWRHPTAPR